MFDIGVDELRRTGTSRAERVPQGPPPEDFICPTETPLGSLTADYAIFNHGCLHTHGGLPPGVDVVAEFVERHPDPGCAVGLTIWPDPIFRGIDVRKPDRPQDEWDRRLYLCPLQYWRDLYLHLCRVSILSGNRCVMATHQAVSVPDWYSFASTPFGPPPATVHVFGVDAGDGGRTKFVRRPAAGPRSPAWCVVRMRGNPEVDAVGAAFVGGASNPFDAVEGAWLVGDWKSQVACASSGPIDRIDGAVQDWSWVTAGHIRGADNFTRTKQWRK